LVDAETIVLAPDILLSLAMEASYDGAQVAITAGG
jgi:hypothetical protein